MSEHELSRIGAAEQAERVVQRLMRRYSADTRGPAPDSSQDPAFRRWLALASGMMPAAMERAEPTLADTRLIPTGEARRRLCVALRTPDQATALVLADPFDRAERLWIEARLRQEGRLRTRWYVAPAPALLAFVERVEQARLEHEVSRFGVRASRHDDIGAAGTPALEPLNRLLRLAFERGASHLHLDLPAHDPAAASVRLRIDGRLQPAGPSHPDDERPAPAGEMLHALAAMLSPQILRDGQLDIVQGGRPLSLPVEVHPGHIVLRLPDRDDRQPPPSLEALGLAPATCAALRQALRPVHGLTLLVAPAGQGLSTLLRALAGQSRQEGQLALVLDAPDRDAVEHGLRRDPDRLLIDQSGEMSPGAAERLADLALEGRALVLAVRAASPWSAIERLHRAGLPRQVIGRSLGGMLVQQLLPRICPHCEGSGCPDCEGSGRLGRCVIESWIGTSRALAEAIETGAPAARLDRLAQQRRIPGMAERLQQRLRSGEIAQEDAERAAPLAP